jgi:hypothetical protein
MRFITQTYERDLRKSLMVGEVVFTLVSRSYVDRASLDEQEDQ